MCLLKNIKTKLREKKVELWASKEVENKKNRASGRNLLALMFKKACRFGEFGGGGDVVITAS